MKTFILRRMMDDATRRAIHELSDTSKPALLRANATEPELDAARERLQLIAAVIETIAEYGDERELRRAVRLTEPNPKFYRCSVERLCADADCPPPKSGAA